LGYEPSPPLLRRLSLRPAATITAPARSTAIAARTALTCVSAVFGVADEAAWETTVEAGVESAAGAAKGAEDIEGAFVPSVPPVVVGVTVKGSVPLATPLAGDAPPVASVAAWPPPSTDELPSDLTYVGLRKAPPGKRPSPKAPPRLPHAPNAEGWRKVLTEPDVEGWRVGRTESGV